MKVLIILLFILIGHACGAQYLSGIIKASGHYIYYKQCDVKPDDYYLRQVDSICHIALETLTFSDDSVHIILTPCTWPDNINTCGLKAEDRCQWLINYISSRTKIRKQYVSVAPAKNFTKDDRYWTFDNVDAVQFTFAKQRP